MTASVMTVSSWLQSIYPVLFWFKKNDTVNPFLSKVDISFVLPSFIGLLFRHAVPFGFYTVLPNL